MYLKRTKHLYWIIPQKIPSTIKPNMTIVPRNAITGKILGKKFNNFNMFLVNKFLNRIKKNQLWSVGLIRSRQSFDHSLQTTNKKDCSCPCSKHNKIWLQEYVLNTKENIENTNTKIDWKYCSESQEMTSCELRLHMFKMKNVDIYHWILHRYIEILFPCTNAIEKENVFKVRR